MLLSDRDLKAAIASGRMALSPSDEAMVQPSSIDVLLDRYFRVFANHRYTHIDPAVQQDDLTELVEVGDDDGEEPSNVRAKPTSTASSAGARPA